MVREDGTHFRSTGRFAQDLPTISLAVVAGAGAGANGSIPAVTY